MKIKNILIFFLLIYASSEVKAQTLAMEKFRFMEGDFMVRGSDGKVSANFDSTGKLFKWKYESPKKRSTATIFYDDISNTYRLTEFEKGLIITYYSGFPTTNGFHFFEMSSMNGAPTAGGKEIELNRMSYGMVSMKRLQYLRVDSSCKGGFISEYFKELSPDDTKAIKKDAMRKIDFIVGTFSEEGRKAQVKGGLINDGAAYGWHYEGASNASDATITYNYYTDMYSLTEGILTLPGTKKMQTTIYEGNFDKGILKFLSSGKDLRGINLSSPIKGKVVMDRTDGVKSLSKNSYLLMVYD